MSKKKQPLKKENPNSFVRSVLEVFQSNPFSGFNYKQVAGRLGVKDNASRELVNGIVEKLYENGQLVQAKRGKYQL